MEMFKRTMIAGLAVALLLTSAGFGQRGAGGRPGGMGGMGGMRGDGPGGGGCEAGMMLQMKEKLELNAEQVKQLEAIRDEVQGKFKAGMEAVKAKREAMQKLVESGASEAVIRAAAGEVGKAIGDEAVLRAGTKAKVDAVLTAAQKTRLQELKKERKEQFGKGEQAMGADSKGGKAVKGPQMGGDAKAVFSKIDTNGDGAISLEEWTAHTEKMKQMRDRHGDKGPESQCGPMPEGPVPPPVEE